MPQTPIVHFNITAADSENAKFKSVTQLCNIYCTVISSCHSHKLSLKIYHYQTNTNYINAWHAGQ